MDKADEAFRTIGELSAELGVKPHILRYWEEQFPMFTPLKRAGNRRYYRAEDVALARSIHRLLNEEGYTIKGAVKLLRGKGRGRTDGAELPASPELADAPGLGGDIPASAQPADAEAPPPAPMQHARYIDDLRSIRERLSEALASS